MPAKKAKKPVPKAKTKATKKPAVKKVAAKKTAPKVTPKKPTKTATKAASKKLPAKKIVAKKIEKKAVKKPAPQKVVKKVLPKKAAKVVAKKEVKAAKKIEKISTKKTEQKAEPKQSLAKVILAKNSKNREEQKLQKAEPLPTKSIFLRKYENRSNKVTFKVGDYAVYPSHGVGKIVEIEKTSILDQELSCYLMYFEREKLTIKIPTTSAGRIGLRPLISKSQVDEVFVILRSGVKKLKGMWSRRAQEYETKINSGDITLLAEVLRDLTRDIEDSERSYSERIIYETAIYRLASEYSVVYGLSFDEAKDKVISTAKDKLNAEGKVMQKDEFDDFDDITSKSKGDDEDSEDEDSEEEEEDEDSDEEDDDFDYDDEDEDDAPRKKRKK
jgi:CarD family transcriptional regulator